MFTRLGSTAAMAEWAKDNLTEFYKLYARLIPQTVDGKIEVAHTVETGSAAALTSRLRPPADAPNHTVQ